MSELNYDIISKMKVSDLKSALLDHGLDTKGTKPILIARLQSYMESQPSKNAKPFEEMAEESSPAKKAKFDVVDDNVASDQIVS